MKTVSLHSEMQELSLNLRRKGKSIGFVPTMGYLHKGHISLIRRAREENNIVIVSIYVNPTQFGRGEDFQRYPRDINRDKSILEGERVDILFNPENKEMYPEEFSTYVEETSLSKKWEGEKRPTHFRGVTTVVAKLFNIVLPDKAYFGEKDWQQQAVIKRMVRDLNFPVKIVTCPTIREDDGLACSSRNSYLSQEGRKSATILYHTLKKGKEMIEKGEKSIEKIINELKNSIKKEEPSSELDYLALVNPDTMEELKRIEKKNLFIIALRIEGVRLIDNMEVNL